MLQIIIDLLFPPRCLHCLAYLEKGAVVCAECLPRAAYRSLFCGRCRARLPLGRQICHRGEPFVLGGAGPYEGSLKSLVRGLKFGGVRDAAEPLGGILAAYALSLSLPVADHLIIPVPQSSRRRRERGFNQAELIARSFAAVCGANIATDALRRTRHGRPQSMLRDKKEREQNVAGCFAADQTLVARQNIILMDDVSTSGSTFREAALALKRAGAGRIIALAAALA